MVEHAVSATLCAAGKLLLSPGAAGLVEDAPFVRARLEHAANGARLTLVACEEGRGALRLSRRPGHPTWMSRAVGLKPLARLFAGRVNLPLEDVAGATDLRSRRPAVTMIIPVRG